MAETVKTLIGNIKGPKGDTGAKGDKGDKGDTGDTGQRGSRWNSGTAITGTSTIDTVFSGSGISDALANDMYLNTSTGNTYRCTVSGDADTAMWVYTGNIKGEKGDSVNIATTEQAGKVKPDGDTITVDADGTIHGQSKVDEMTGATADKDGASGTVPAPTAGQEAHILNGDGTWTSPLDNKLIASKFKELDENKSDVVIDKSTGKKVVFTIENGIICAREA